MLGTTLSLLMLGNAAAIDLRPSIQDQIKIGKEAAADIRKKEKVLPASDPRSKLLNDLGKKMVQLIPKSERDRRPFEYTFEVIESKDVNAFALPGGPVFFYTGLIDKMSTVDQLAGVLGHEIIHVRNQHWASQYADNTKRRLGLAVLLGLLNANETMYDVASIVDTGAFMLTYSRRHESEADKVGYDLVLGAGYNPAGMADVFEIFAGGKKEASWEEFLSTHPDPVNRSKAIRTRITKEKKQLPAQRALPFETQKMRDDKAKPTSERMPSSKREEQLHAEAGCWCPGH